MIKSNNFINSNKVNITPKYHLITDSYDFTQPIIIKKSKALSDISSLIEVILNMSTDEVNFEASVIHRQLRNQFNLIQELESNLLHPSSISRNKFYTNNLVHNCSKPDPEENRTINGFLGHWSVSSITNNPHYFQRELDRMFEIVLTKTEALDSYRLII